MVKPDDSEKHRNYALSVVQCFVPKYNLYKKIGNDAKSGWCRIGSNDQNCTILVICVS